MLKGFYCETFWSDVFTLHHVKHVLVLVCVVLTSQDWNWLQLTANWSIDW
jgi:hypothetical protein